MVVADTDVLIDALERTRGPAVKRIGALIQRGELATTAISLYELTAGPGTTGAHLEILRAQLDPVLVLPVTPGAAHIAASANRYLSRRGQAIAIPDTLIAGVCIAHGLSLLTGNVKHFGRVPGLELVSLEDRE
ncbi:MAG TPA: type II toxin-antitoxin system VapC family toxin [Anaeromyxobacteraceae bacterium]|nr:type II toxin-antitoxin system VapC family toxin [Anaeromyxobacteraceae bacterium]